MVDTFLPLCITRAGARPGAPRLPRLVGPEGVVTTPLRLGLLGFGTVGKALVRLVEAEAPRLARDLGVDLRFVAVASRALPAQGPGGPSRRRPGQRGPPRRRDRARRRRRRRAPRRARPGGPARRRGPRRPERASSPPTSSSSRRAGPSSPRLAREQRRRPRVRGRRRGRHPDPARGAGRASPGTGSTRSPESSTAPAISS